MSRPSVPPPALAMQRRATDPQQSAWVAANAGSGKTYVLVRRVVRLILNGTAPGAILCLTFTKAAAATMANRVFDLLAGWIRLDDAALAAELTDIEGAPPSADKLRRARRLFAEALETPGGLKIQTIHAFCERLLHVFPFEANVAAAFSVLDDRETMALRENAKRHVLSQALAEPQGDLGRALAVLSARMADSTLDDLIAEALTLRDQFGRTQDLGTRLDAIADRIGDGLGLIPSQTMANLEAEEVAELIIPAAEWKPLADTIAALSSLKTEQEMAERLRKADTGVRFGSYRAIFLTQEDRARKSLLTKAAATAEPQLQERLLREQARLVAIAERKRSVRLRDGTAALLVLAQAVLADVEAAKRRSGKLDFDDLIAHARNLFTRVSAQWVLYKLDGQIEHILVDEAQDTSPAQWDLVAALVAEFTAGAGTRVQDRRTLFVVGDEKQSIFSFQGADPQWFDRMRQTFAQRFGAAGKTFDTSIHLSLSFRTVPEILGAVDRIFSDSDARRGLSSSDTAGTAHTAARHADSGVVEMWPTTDTSDDMLPKPWDAPVDMPSRGSSTLILARRIADHVRIWLQRRECLPARNHPIRPGDILILVRSRNALFHAIIRALKAQGIPVAGADRLVLNDHIAVMDLLALGDALLLPQDDLSLACALKSPLFGMTDDDLLRLAPQRAGALIDALREQEPEHYQQFMRWRQEALRVAPSALFGRILARDGGRRAILARLGTEAGEAIDELLNLAHDFERREPASLAGFLHFIRAARTEVKRDMDEGRNEVRVMTVHGSKGLEADIVFMADTFSAPSGRHDPKIFATTPPNSPAGTAPLLVWVPSKGSDIALTADARARAQDAQQKEFRRLLYVGLTRARDKLVICGAKRKRDASGHWNELISRTLDADGLLEEADDGIGEVRRWYDPARGARRFAEPSTADLGVEAALPAVLTRPAPKPPQSAAPLSPSLALDEGGGGMGSLDRAAALRRGVLTHRLLQSLPDVARDDRAAAAERFLRRQNDLTESEIEAIAASVLRLMDEPPIAPLFSRPAQAEVPVVGYVGHRLVSGQIDRLVVDGDRVVIADFKTNAMPPASLAEVPSAYILQMALYGALLRQIHPDKRMSAVLVWTANGTASVLPDAALEAALQDFSVNAD